MIGSKRSTPRNEERGGAVRCSSYYSIEELPDGCTAAGQRPGVCNSLILRMPTELVVATNGHDLTKMSAFFEYCDADRTLCVLGAVALSGWEPLLWGHLTLLAALGAVQTRQPPTPQ